ncbi:MULTISPECIES: MarR family transcriptional regulator [Brevibacillus]|uniref:MarR family transcriptional regulator n=1 Tax=Brevibacillus TaxID=55080 RepID=UPI000D1053A2|nr:MULTISPECIES: MarR family transcriptional regulator [Brevibacillus]PSJ70474.1 MarR family transcriptional regulator [Brevibacillus brevis]RED30803.1 DNA-binding MarR family transcriptional regulator [Brevibacillus brevis]TQK63232.1 DNA-binding MarR family transcriptional regulator [Brevibacillus sp. AG162]VEF89983.1 Predicted transcriptional regulator [Brevibacillus brevis]GEC88939.1 putative HTH-type transcriptional regulator YhjH [Brevibacillus brevis]
MQNTELSKQRIMQLYIQLVTQQEQRESNLTTRMAEEMQKLESEMGMKLNLTLSEIHFIACIGDHGPINVTTISEKVNLTKGSITRISKKLWKLDLIKRQQLVDNKKEVYYRLTAKGQKLYKIHHQVHQDIEQRFMGFLDKYTPEQLAFSRELLEDLLDWDF